MSAGHTATHPQLGLAEALAWTWAAEVAAQAPEPAGQVERGGSPQPDGSRAVTAP